MRAENSELCRAGLQAENSWAGADASRTVILNTEKDIHDSLFIVMKINRNDLKSNRRKYQGIMTYALDEI